MPSAPFGEPAEANMEENTETDEDYEARQLDEEEQRRDQEEHRQRQRDSRLRSNWETLTYEQGGGMTMRNRVTGEVYNAEQTQLALTPEFQELMFIKDDTIGGKRKSQTRRKSKRKLKRKTIRKRR